MGRLASGKAIVRHHIILIAVAAALVFGWMMTGVHPWLAAAICGIDWFFINLFNRVTDVAEDQKNGVPGAGWIAKHARFVQTASVVALVVSLIAFHVVIDALTPWRVLVHVVGFAYSSRMLPWFGGARRLKSIYLAKNLGSAGLFVLTCFVYPLVAHGGELVMSAAAIALLIAYFVPFELTYEIIYDLRDVPGDRAENLPTFPVVHGARVSLQIIQGLAIFSVMVLSVGVGSGQLGLRELLLMVAPIGQLGWLVRQWPRGIDHRACVGLTHLGTAQLALFGVGTQVWLWAGLPANLTLAL